MSVTSSGHHRQLHRDDVSESQQTCQQTWTVQMEDGSERRHLVEQLVTFHLTSVNMCSCILLFSSFSHAGHRQFLFLYCSQNSRETGNQLVMLNYLHAISAGECKPQIHFMFQELIMWIFAKQNSLSGLSGHVQIFIYLSSFHLSPLWYLRWPEQQQQVQVYRKSFTVQAVKLKCMKPKTHKKTPAPLTAARWQRLSAAAFADPDVCVTPTKELIPQRKTKQNMRHRRTHLRTAVPAQMEQN